MQICEQGLPRGEIVAVVHSKGGAGKTSWTLNTAHALATTGAKVLVIDLDTQMGQRAFIDDSTLEAPGVDETGQKPRTVTIDDLHETGRGIGYTKSPFAYRFARVS